MRNEQRGEVKLAPVKRQRWLFLFVSVGFDGEDVALGASALDGTYPRKKKKKKEVPLPLPLPLDILTPLMLRKAD